MNTVMSVQEVIKKIYQYQMWLIKGSSLRNNTTAILRCRILYSFVPGIEALLDERRRSCRSRVGEYFWMHCGYTLQQSPMSTYCVAGQGGFLYWNVTRLVTTAVAAWRLCSQTQLTAVRVTHATCVHLGRDWCQQLLTLISRHLSAKQA